VLYGAVLTEPARSHIHRSPNRLCTNDTSVFYGVLRGALCTQSRPLCTYLWHVDVLFLPCQKLGSHHMKPSHLAFTLRAVSPAWSLWLSCRQQHLIMTMEGRTLLLLRPLALFAAPWCAACMHTFMNHVDNVTETTQCIRLYTAHICGSGHCMCCN